MDSSSDIIAESVRGPTGKQAGGLSVWALLDGLRPDVASPEKAAQNASIFGEHQGEMTK